MMCDNLLQQKAVRGLALCQPGRQPVGCARCSKPALLALPHSKSSSTDRIANCGKFAGEGTCNKKTH
eukprot:767955-Hanusia_phi.AAC.16